MPEDQVSIRPISLAWMSMSSWGIKVADQGVAPGANELVNWDKRQMHLRFPEEVKETLGILVRSNSVNDVIDVTIQVQFLTLGPLVGLAIIASNRRSLQQEVLLNGLVFLVVLVSG
jgi:hypothetical protein